MATEPRRLSPLFTWRSALAESDLPPTLRHVGLTLSLHMNERGGSAFPSHTTLARETGLHRATVIKALGDLEARGYVEREPGGGRGHTTTYRATVPAETVAHDDGSELSTIGQTVAVSVERVAVSDSNSRPARHRGRTEDVKRTGAGLSTEEQTLLERAVEACLRDHRPEGLRYTARGLCEPCDARLDRATLAPRRSA